MKARHWAVARLYASRAGPGFPAAAGNGSPPSLSRPSAVAGRRATDLTVRILASERKVLASASRW